MPFKEPSSEGQIVVYSWLYVSSIRTFFVVATPNTIKLVFLGLNALIQVEWEEVLVVGVAVIYPGLITQNAPQRT